MYSSLYLVIPALLLSRFQNEKRPHDYESREASLPPRAPPSALHVGLNLAVRRAVSQGGDRQQPVGGVLDLQRRVVDPKPVGEHLLELATDPVAILAAVDPNVRRQGGETRADLPDVEGMNVGHAPLR